MSFFVDKLGPLPGQQTGKAQKSVGGADLLKHPSKAPPPQAAKASQRAQQERAAPPPRAVDRAPAKEEPKKKKGWFG